MHRSAGFTLLELLVVIGLLAVLTGLSVGYLGRTDPQMVANAVIGGELRQAQMTARGEGVPTEVTIHSDGDGAPWVVQSRLLQPVVTFHFEPDEKVLDESLRGSVGGQDVPDGRFGHARATKLGDQNALLGWQVSPSLLDLREGFVVRADVWLERRDSCSVLRLPPAVDLSIDENGRARARFRVRGASSEAPTTAAIGGGPVLPLRKWFTLDAACDGRSAWLMLDSCEIARGVAEGTPQQEPDARFEVSPTDAPLPGAVDEVRWFVYVMAPAQQLPLGLVPAKPYRFTFDARGEPVERPEIRFLSPEEIK